MPGGGEVMITPPGILGKVGSFTAAMKGGREIRPLDSYVMVSAVLVMHSVDYEAQSHPMLKCSQTDNSINRVINIFESAATLAIFVSPR